MTVVTNHYHKTRIAPTPSGFLHLGNVLSFAITASIARKSGAKILLRIDDIDQPRVNKAYIQDIFDTLNFLEIPWDEGPGSVKEFEDTYSQLHRMDLYNDALKQLSDKKLVYACTCSRSQLNNEECLCYQQQIPLHSNNVSWRLQTNNNGELNIKDYDGQAIHTTLPAEMHNFVVKKKDGFPSYQLTSVIDDIFYGIDLIIRGADLWKSTVAQHQLAIAMGKTTFTQLAFYHHPLINDTTGNKLSKSAGATSVKYLRENGKTAGDIFMIIAEIIRSNEKVSNWQQLADISINH